MSLPRTEVTEGLQQELADFAALLRKLEPAQWEAPSRCEGWTAADVAAHVTGQFADIVAGRFDGLGTPEVTNRQVEERRGRTADEIADELEQAAEAGAALLAVFDDESWAGPSPAGTGTLGSGVEALWMDAWMHADDIRAAAGLPPAPTPGAMKVSVSHIAEILEQQGYGPATITVDGVPETPVGTGDGPRITGDAYRFVLTATGRGNPAELGLDETVNIYR